MLAKKNGLLLCWLCSLKICVCASAILLLHSGSGQYRWPLKYTQLQPMTFLSVVQLHLSVFPSSTLSISLSTLLASSPVWVTAALFQFSVHFLLWWTPAVRVHQNWQSTHLCASCSLSFLIYYYYSSRWSFANYDHNHEIKPPTMPFSSQRLM